MRNADETQSYASSSGIHKRRSTTGNRYNVDKNRNYGNTYVSLTELIKYNITTPEPPVDHAENIEFYNLILRHTWTLFRVAPLHDIQFTKVKLKHYAARIKRSLARNLHDTNNNLVLNATVGLIEETQTTKILEKALKIEVTQQRGQSDPQLVYRGILLVLDDDRLQSILTRYPLLLCTGLASIIRIVHKTLQECFSTVIRQQRLRQDDIKWLSLLTTWSTKKKNNIQYVYLHSSSTKSTGNFIQISLDSSDLRYIWNKLHPPDSDEIFFEEVDKFYKCLNMELNNSFNGFHFDKLNIHKIKLPDMTIHSVGKIKFHQKDNVMKILDFLTCIVNILDDTQPWMGFKNEF